MAARKPAAKKKEHIKIGPQPGPQERFLATAADIAIYGGAAGGGKTFALLLEPLRHIKKPDFRAVIFRRTRPMHTKSGSTWDQGRRLYGGQLSAQGNQSGLSFDFPSGARISFGQLQHEDTVNDWKSSEIPLLEFDELTEFTEFQFFYMLSRNRSTCGVRPYVRAGCNPDADSWVAKFLQWWIDQATGLPIAERAGVLRWFHRDGEKLEWADSPEQLRERFPGSMPKSVTFIPAKLSDNKILMRADPGYLANLLALPPVERERLLGGNWKVRAAAGKLFNRAWFELVEAVPRGGVDCRFWDFAATKKTLKKKDPDWSAGVKMRRPPDGFIYVTDCIDVQEGPAAVEKLFMETCRSDDAMAKREMSYFFARWEIEPGSAAVREAQRFAVDLAGIDAMGIPVQGKGDKWLRARPFATYAQAGNVRCLIAPWTERFLNHLHHQPDIAHDDIMDAAAGCFSSISDFSEFRIVMPREGEGGFVDGAPAGVFEKE
jgi:predicted phage terminase large subunit-like protein